MQGSNTTSWEYNEAYELVALSMPQGGLEYEYDDLGRFLSRDPVGDGSNWYAYCRNNPIKFADPTGNIAWFAAGLIFALVLTPTYTGQDPQEEPDEKDYSYETILWTTVIPIEGVIVLAGAKLLKWLCALRMARATAAFEALVEEAAKKIPSSWGKGRPTRKGGGTRWSDPSNPNNSVRIDPANPNSPFPSQRQPHVIVNSNGRVVGKYGPLPPNSRIKDFAKEAHISLDEWLKWPQWNSPVPK